MTDYSTDEPVESGALDDDPPESGDLQEAQEGKGYGAGEGEREQALDE